jgi:hypothetical protein
MGWPFTTTAPTAPSSVGQTPPPSLQSSASTRAFLVAFGLWFIETVIADVAIAFGGISIAGFDPLAFLKTWGINLQNKANDAFENAQAAQTTADGANTTGDNIIDVIIGGLTDDVGTTGNPVEALGAAVAGLRGELDAVGDAAGGAFALARQLSQQMLTIIQKSETTIVTPVAQIVSAFAFWTFGWFTRTEVAHTPQNAAIASLRGEMNARLASIATGTTGWVDNFDTPGYSLTTNYAATLGEASSILGSRDGVNTVLEPPASARATMYRTVQCDTGQVDNEMAISNLAQSGRAALWIGAPSGSLSGGLQSGTLLVRIDNGFSDPTKQRLQILTVTSTGTLATHGNLYSVDMGTWHDGDLIRLRKDENTQKHYVFGNTVQACLFDDSLTNLIAAGAGTRYGGWRQNVDSSSGSNVGPDLDLIHLYDWTT